MLHGRIVRHPKHRFRADFSHLPAPFAEEQLARRREAVHRHGWRRGRSTLQACPPRGEY
ncbi:hypothetical protein MPLSOD_10095 [Mesorhizobium sp. SOD10]|nr:hypothetical protein MPLSOD_10095 [Mesorhizobium sp. SOD10]